MLKCLVSDHLDGFTVRQLFGFLKENIIFDIFENELIERNVFTDEVSVEYINTVPGNNYRIEKVLKLFIRKNRCNEFIVCMQKSYSHRHVYDRIQRFQRCEAIKALKGKEYVIKNYLYQIDYLVDKKMFPPKTKFSSDIFLVKFLDLNL